MPHEVGFDGSFEDIMRFAQNILVDAHKVMGLPQERDINVSYWNAATNVLLVRKIDVALAGLATTIKESAKAASTDAQAATTQARNMVRATWGLVAVTFGLAIVTAFLVFYTRELVKTSAAPVVSASSGPAAEQPKAATSAPR